MCDLANVIPLVTIRYMDRRHYDGILTRRVLCMEEARHRVQWTYRWSAPTLYIPAVIQFIKFHGRTSYTTVVVPSIYYSGANRMQFVVLIGSPAAAFIFYTLIS